MSKMEKHIQRQDSNLQFNKNVPGCFWNIFHTIDHHRWHNVKKMLPHKKHSRSKGGPKSTPNNHRVAKVSEQSNDENNPLVCTEEYCPIRRKPGEAHVNEVIALEMSEDEIQKFWKLNSSSKRRLIRTQSIHHLEPLHHSPGCNGKNGDNGVAPQQKTPMKLATSGMRSISLPAMDNDDYFCQRKIDIQLTSFTKKSNGVKKNLETNKINRSISGRSFKEDAHIQEIFKANRKLFAELLKGARGKNTRQTSQNKKSSASLAKSGSFPAPGFAPKEYKKLSSLRHKQIESYPKQKSNSPHSSKLVESESPKNFHEDMTPSDSHSTSSHNISQQPTPSSLGSNRGLRHGGWNQLVVKRFNFIKQKIRRSLKEMKKGNNQKTSKEIPTVNYSGHELPLYREEVQERIGTATNENVSGIKGYSETSNSENDNLSNGVQTKTPVDLPSASLEKYSQLADGSGIRGYNGTNNSENDNLSIGVQTQTAIASQSASPIRYSQLSDVSGIREYSETSNSDNDNLSNEVQTKTAIASPSASLERFSQLSDGSSIRGYSETDNSEKDILNNRVQTKTGTASASASLERYSQLSEYGFDKKKEAKCYQSQSSRLISEEKIPNIEKPKKIFGRNFSSPDIDLFCTLFTDRPVVSHTKKPKRGLAHSSTYNNIRTDKNLAHLLSVHVSIPLYSDSPSMIEKGGVNMPVDYSGTLNEVTNDEGASGVDELEDKIPHLDISDGKRQVSGSECIVEDVREIAELISDLSHIDEVLELETCFEDDDAWEFSDSEGEILYTGCSINELEPSDDQPNEARTEAYETIVNYEIIDDAEKISNRLHLHSELSRIDNADFNYMRYILQLSSFIESGHIIDRPLNSSIFVGEEAHFYKKLECYWGKVDKDFDHQLLLDLVYETLHNVYENSFISFLKTFSSTSQIHPMSLGQYLLEEVREKVTWYLRLGPELDQCLDDVVGRDLNKGDDWMNLQSETEYIILDLEDLIIDELLDEVISF